MAEYNIDNVSRLMNENLETPTKKKHEEISAKKEKKNPIPLKNIAKAKTKKNENPFTDKKTKDKENPFAKEKPASGKGGPVEESIYKLINLLEFLDPSGLRNKSKGFKPAPGATKKSVGKLPTPMIGTKKPAATYALDDGNMIIQNQRALNRKGSNFQQDRGPARKDIGTKDPYATIAGRMVKTGRGSGPGREAWDKQRMAGDVKKSAKIIEEMNILYEKIIMVNHKNDPKGTLDLLKQLGAAVNKLEASSDRFDYKRLKEVINKFGNLAQTYSYVSENPPHKIQQLMKQDPKNQAHYQKMLDYANKNLPLLSEYTRYKSTFEKHYNDFISDHGM